MPSVQQLLPTLRFSLPFLLLWGRGADFFPVADWTPADFHIQYHVLGFQESVGQIFQQ